jgi:hypothetical protein
MANRTLINGAKYRDAPPRLVARVLARREITPEGCWLWPQVQPDGYGHITYRDADRKTIHLTVHRLIYVHLVGDPGDTMVLDHMCHDPDVCKLKSDCPHRRCCNPAHLNPCPSGDNALRSYSVSGVNALKTHCDHGHEFTPANTRIHPDGSRVCRECKRLWAEAQRLAIRLAERRFCQECGASISHRNRRAIYCEPCAVIVRVRLQRLRSA